MRLSSGEAVIRAALMPGFIEDFEYRRGSSLPGNNGVNDYSSLNDQILNKQIENIKITRNTFYLGVVCTAVTGATGYGGNNRKYAIGTTVLAAGMTLYAAKKLYDCASTLFQHLKSNDSK